MFLTRLKLWQAWWLIWAIPGAILNTAFVVYNALHYTDSPAQNYLPIIAVILLLLLTIYYIFGPYIVWRCSGNCKSKGWRSIAKILLVVGICSGLSFKNLNEISTYMATIGVMCAVLIIVLYLIAKITKNVRLINFNDKYSIPILLMAGYFLVFLSTVFQNY